MDVDAPAGEAGAAAEEDDFPGKFLRGSLRKVFVSIDAVFHADAGGRGLDVGALRGRAEALDETRAWNSV